MKIYIPKNKKIVSKKQSLDIISKFLINIFKDYNSGKNSISDTFIKRK